MARASRALLQTLHRQAHSLPCKRGYSSAVEQQPVASTSAQPFIRPETQAKTPVKVDKGVSKRDKGKEKAKESGQPGSDPLQDPASHPTSPPVSQAAVEEAKPPERQGQSSTGLMTTDVGSASDFAAESDAQPGARYPRSDLLSMESDPSPHLHLLKHPFNTHVFVENLAAAGVPRDRAEVIMEASRLLALREISKAEEVLASKVAAENDAYLYSAALSELRTEVQVDVREETLAQRSANARVHRRIESLSQTTSEQVDSLKSEIKYEFQHSRDETNADFKNLELRLSDVNNRISLMFGREKAEVESLRWILLRNIFLSVAGFALFSVIVNEAVRERPALPTVEQFGVHPLPDQPSEIVDPVPVRRVGEEEDEHVY